MRGRVGQQWHFAQAGDGGWRIVVGVGVLYIRDCGWYAWVATLVSCLEGVRLGSFHQTTRSMHIYIYAPQGISIRILYTSGDPKYRGTSNSKGHSAAP